MKHTLNLIIFAGAVCAGWLTSGCHSGQDKSERQQVSPIDVAAVEVDSVMLHKEFPGYLAADKQVDVVARVDGTLLKQHYNDGDYVNAGQLLFTMESTVFADRVRQAEANLSSARSAYSYASSHYAAVKKAMESDAVSQMELDQALSNMMQAEASIKSAEAALEVARINLSYCYVKAPVSGRCTAPVKSVGSFINGADDGAALATIYDDRTLSAVFNIEDRELINQISSRIASADAQQNTVSLIFENAGTLTGRLSYVDPAINTSTGSVLVKATVPNDGGNLRSGMFVKVSVPSLMCSNAILVKDASIATDQLGRYVYTVNDSNRVVYTPVKVGEMVNDSMRIVTSGLTPDSRYVTRALLKVRNGQEIKPVTVK